MRKSFKAIASLREGAKRARGVNDSLNGCQSPSGPSRSETGDRAGVPRKCLHFWGFAAKRWKEPARVAIIANYRTNALINVNTRAHIFRMNAKKLQIL